MAEEKKLSGPDFAEGVSLSEFADGGMVQGHANGEAILVTRRGDAYVAIGARPVPTMAVHWPKAL